jgi:hypothetical protein
MPSSSWGYRTEPSATVVATEVSGGTPLFGGVGRLRRWRCVDGWWGRPCRWSPRSSTSPLRSRAPVTVTSWRRSIDTPGDGPSVSFAEAATFRRAADGGRSILLRPSIPCCSAAARISSRDTGPSSITGRLAGIEPKSVTSPPGPASAAEPRRGGETIDQGRHGGQLSDVDPDGQSAPELAVDQRVDVVSGGGSGRRGVLGPRWPPPRPADRAEVLGRGWPARHARTRAGSRPGAPRGRRPTSGPPQRVHPR